MPTCITCYLERNAKVVFLWNKGKGIAGKSLCAMMTGLTQESFLAALNPKNSVCLVQ